MALCSPGTLSVVNSAGTWGCIRHSPQCDSRGLQSRCPWVLEGIESSLPRVTEPISGKAGTRIRNSSPELFPSHRTSLKKVTAPTWLMVWELVQLVALVGAEV